MKAKKINGNFDIYDYITVIIADFFKANVEMNDIEQEELYLGILNIVVNITKITFILILAYIFSLVKEVIIIMAAFSALRIFAAGLHARKSFMCTITAVAAFIGGAFLSVNYPMNYFPALISIIAITLLLYVYAPADTENRPIIGKEKRRILKLWTLAVSVFIIIINIFVKSKLLINLTLLAMLYQLVSVLPVTYKILKRRYNNYEEYEE